MRVNRCGRDPCTTRNCSEDLIMLDSILIEALKVWEFLI